MAHEAVQSNIELQLELVRGVSSFGSPQEAAYWARRYELPRDELPYDIRNILNTEQKG